MKLSTCSTSSSLVVAVVGILLLLNPWLPIITTTTFVLLPVNGERMVRFIFNDGMIPDENTYCTAQDNVFIDAIFDTIYDRRYHRRTLESLSQLQQHDRHHQLRGGNNNFDNVNITEISSFNDTTITTTTARTDQDRRELYNWYCRDNCAGYVTGTCRATRCTSSTKGRRNRRRRRHMEARAAIDDHSSTRNEKRQELGQDQRHLDIYSCRTQVSDMNLRLNRLITTNQVSDPCKAYLTIDSREVSCYDDVIYGEVYGVRVWRKNVENGTLSVLHSFMPSRGYTMCKSVHFTFEILNNPCVESASLRIDGPQSYVLFQQEYEAPFTLFGDDGNGTFYTRNLPFTGSYNLTIIPDYLPSKRKVLSFTVADC